MDRIGVGRSLSSLQGVGNGAVAHLGQRGSREDRARRFAKPLTPACNVLGVHSTEHTSTDHC